MDQAKAVINLNEGIIQLEGPVEFVREYLSIYGSAIKGLREIPKEKEAAPEEKTVRGKAKTTRVRLAAKRVSCVDAVRAEVEAGFFTAPRPAQEVRRLLSDKKRICSNNSVTMALKKLVESGLLTRLGVGRATKYQRSG